MNAVQLNLLREEIAPDEIRHTHCLTWEQRAQFGKLHVKVSPKISTAHTAVVPEGLLLIPSAGLCEILAMQCWAPGKQRLSRFVTSLKLSSASSKCVKNFQGNTGWRMAVALEQLKLALADLCFQREADARQTHPVTARAVLRHKQFPRKEQTSLHHIQCRAIPLTTLG